MTLEILYYNQQSLVFVRIVVFSLVLFLGPEASSNRVVVHAAASGTPAVAACPGLIVAAVHNRKPAV
jgi:hypothetical protein